MLRITALASVTVSLMMALGSIPAADAQSLGDRLKRKAKEAAERKAEQKAEETVRCMVDDTACIEKAKAEGKKVETTDESAGGVAAGADAAAGAGGAAGGASASLKPGEGAWANYDFKPGQQILFADDFTKDEVGDFPRRLEFERGTMEIVDWQNARWLRLTSTSRFRVPLGAPLPERYTMEFDFAVPAGEMWIYPGEGENQHIIFGDGGVGGVDGGGLQARSQKNEALVDKMARARVMGDGQYIKVYVNEKRVANIPNFGPSRNNKILFYVDASEEKPALFGNFRIAAGGKKLYDALAEKGRVATQGIYFDIGSDRIRPESTPTLKEIGAMLKEHPDLKLTIEGHTDNVGGAQANHDLSHKRAAAVKQFLVTTYGIDAARIESTGFGDKKPASPNATPEGRQQNRRVELVRM